jgi:hypothetical protein
MEHLKNHTCVQIRNTGSASLGNYTCRRRIHSSIRYFNAKEFRTFSSKSAKPAGLEALEQLNLENKKNTDKINTNLIKLLTNQDVLMAAYTKIKSNPRNKINNIPNKPSDVINEK